jgi:hypothetical protein
MDFDIVPFTRALACQMEAGWIAIPILVVNNNYEV